MIRMPEKIIAVYWIVARFEATRVNDPVSAMSPPSMA